MNPFPTKWKASRSSGLFRLGQTRAQRARGRLQLVSGATASLLVLASCGGSGRPPPPPPQSTVQGTAAVGKPIVNGTLIFQCTGGASISASTGADGRYQVST